MGFPLTKREPFAPFGVCKGEGKKSAGRSSSVAGELTSRLKLARVRGKKTLDD